MKIPGNQTVWRRRWRKTSVAVTKFLRRPQVARALRFAQYGLFALIVGYLLFRLSQVGWREVLGSLPQSPWFYVFFVFRFLALPVSELAIYEIIWSKPLIRHFFVFIRKRVYNFAVMGYSGEAFLTLWARRRLDLSDKQIIVGIKDNNLLSAFASNAATVALIAILAATGMLTTVVSAFPGAGALFAIAFATATSLAIAFIVFRRTILALPNGVLPNLLTVHAVRQITLMLLHAAMYSAALPGAPLSAWIAFIAMQLVLSRVPFLPNQDIVYLTAALALSPIVGAPEAVIAGMLVAEAGLAQLANVALFAVTAPLARTQTDPAVARR